MCVAMAFVTLFEHKFLHPISDKAIHGRLPAKIKNLSRPSIGELVISYKSHYNNITNSELKPILHGNKKIMFLLNKVNY